MGQKLVVGPVSKGLKTNPLAFYIDNDSFPTLQNAYQWRGRVKRKRGTSLLVRLTRFFNSAISSYGNTTSFNLVAGAGNLLTGFNLESSGNIVPGSISFLDSTSGQTYTDSNKDGTLQGTGGGTGTINYATGAITITAGAGDTISTASFLYYPDLPVMGLESLTLQAQQFPGLLGFDTTYSYNITTSLPAVCYDVSFYKNPAANGITLPGYVPKSTPTPVRWNGQNYQQFWTTNYQNALWATNGIQVPFSTTNIGMPFKPIVTVTVTPGGPPSIVDLNIVGHGLVVGDFLFINEVITTTGINWQTGYVTVVVDANKVTVEFPNATITTDGTGGIAQYLTNNPNSTKDCIRWYDGDPTNGNAVTPGFVQGLGWVNFCPPLSQAPFSIGDALPAVYYLVGARVIVPYKDRILFFGPVIQASTGNPIYLQDTVVYSENGTPYYTSSYKNTPSATVDTPTNVTNVFHPILTPVNQGASPAAFFEDSTGFGGNISAGFAQPILTVSPNEDTLIVGFSNRQTRFLYTGNDLVPFNFYVTNSEFGSSSTFSVVTLDRGVLSVGDRGIVVSNQYSSQRIDLDIPDQIFQFNLTGNGPQRVSAQRDFISEWVYFTYLSNGSPNIFPNQSLQYNYRDDSWGIFNECYTTYGLYQVTTGYTWANIGMIYPTWSVWNEPWNAGSSTLLQPKVIGGNQQGFVLVRETGTSEGNSLYIQSFSGSQVTSPQHCLNDNDYIIINGCIGTIGAQVNGKIFQVTSPTTNTFNLNPPIALGTYSGGGTIQRLYVPLIQTKQFPTGWQLSRKTRIGPQQYLLTGTNLGQIELQIYLNQNASGSSAQAYNSGPIIPSPNTQNNALVYTDTLYTCPESINLGLTPANINLQMLTAEVQEQIWHRVNTSLLGDTVQLGFTLSNAQMTAYALSGPSFSITGATNAYPCVLTTNAGFGAGTLVQIVGVQGMTQLNNNTALPNPYYQVISSDMTTVTINVDSSAFGVYSSGGTIQSVLYPNQQEEIELHGFVIDLNPSQMLA